MLLSHCYIMIYRTSIALKLLSTVQKNNTNNLIHHAKTGEYKKNKPPWEYCTFWNMSEAEKNEIPPIHIPSIWWWTQAEPLLPSLLPCLFTTLSVAWKNQTGSSSVNILGAWHYASPVAHWISLLFRACSMGQCTAAQYCCRDPTVTTGIST